MRCTRRARSPSARRSDDQIDIAPVDAEIEGRRADDGAQLSGCHRRFDFATLGDVERAVVERDGEVSLR